MRFREVSFIITWIICKIMRMNLINTPGSIRIYPIVLIIILCLLPSSGFVTGFPASEKDNQSAEQFYRQATQQDAKLQSTAREKRTLQFYTDVVRLYTRVPDADPGYPRSSEALFRGSVLAREAAKLCQSDVMADKALFLLDWLIKEYPAAPLRGDALILQGDIFSEDQNKPALAKAAYADFLHLYAKSPRAAEVNAKLSALGGVKSPLAAEKPPPKPKEVPPAPVSTATPAATVREDRGIVAQLLDIRYWSTSDYTRIVIDLDNRVDYQQNEVSDPYRVYFDFQKTVLTAALKYKNFAVGDYFLDRIRIGQNREDVVRVVLDFKKKGAFTVFTLYDPFRIVVDIRDPQAKPSAEERKARLAGLLPRKNAEEPAATSAEPSVKPAGQAAEPPVKTAGEKPAAAPEGSGGENQKKPAGHPPAEKEVKPASEAISPPPPVDKKAETPQPPAEKKAGTSDVPKTPDKPDSTESAPGRPAEPNADGRRTLTRILGMKVGKIVIDPGHGGKDTGSIGYQKIKEKDVTLAIALELKAEIEKNLSNIVVILTRDKDVFVPLEQRTAIANVEKADLFISLHANSSRNNRITGIETFYLGLTRDPRSQLLATLENATSEQNLSQLEDVIKKITLYEKMNESKDFALKVHHRTCQTIQKFEASARDRGVKTAPFVVLIGANHPAILLEIGFISNRKEAQIISRKDSQNKVAAGIYQGVEDYLNSLGTVSHNTSADEADPGNAKSR